MNDLLPTERIIDKVIILRGEKVMLDRDLALLYGVETKRINEAVKRNIERFPEDFMFELSENEFVTVRSQFATSRNTNEGGSRHLPHAFTEYGILMLSSVLRSPQAIQTNIAVIRVFHQMRKMLESNQELRNKLDVIEKQVLSNSQEIQNMWFEIKKVMLEDRDDQRPIGFRLLTED